MKSIVSSSSSRPNNHITSDPPGAGLDLGAEAPVQKKRMGRDSNPRSTLALSSFQDCRLSPLGHPSGEKRSINARFFLIGREIIFFACRRAKTKHKNSRFLTRRTKKDWGPLACAQPVKQLDPFGRSFCFRVRRFLSHKSTDPRKRVGARGFEPRTSSLSGMRSKPTELCALILFWNPAHTTDRQKRLTGAPIRGLGGDLSQQSLYFTSRNERVKGGKRKKCDALSLVPAIAGPKENRQFGFATLACLPKSPIFTCGATPLGDRSIPARIVNS